mgnify:CR=1 FL=1
MGGMGSKGQVGVKARQAGWHGGRTVAGVLCVQSCIIAAEQGKAAQRDSELSHRNRATAAPARPPPSRQAWAAGAAAAAAAHLRRQRAPQDVGGRPAVYAIQIPGMPELPLCVPRLHKGCGGWGVGRGGAASALGGSREVRRCRGRGDTGRAQAASNLQTPGMWQPPLQPGLPHLRLADPPRLACILQRQPLRPQHSVEERRRGHQQRRQRKGAPAACVCV